MRRMLTGLIVMIALLAPAAGAQTVFAANAIPACNGGTAATTDVCKSYNANKGGNTNPVVKVIKSAIEVLTYIIGIAAVIGLIINGIRFMTSGDSQSAVTARNGVIYSLIGIAVTVLAGTIVAFVLSKF